MDTISTITERGQVVIPQPIRQILGLKTADRLLFEVDNNRIIAQPLLTIKQAMGIIKTQKMVSKEEYKKTIAQAVAEKHKKP